MYCRTYEAMYQYQVDQGRIIYFPKFGMGFSLLWVLYYGNKCCISKPDIQVFIFWTASRVTFLKPNVFKFRIFLKRYLIEYFLCTITFMEWNPYFQYYGPVFSDITLMIHAYFKSVLKFALPKHMKLWNWY